eukprot:Nk52_evm9s207 gene=Nk52_evmTU9s207
MSNSTATVSLADFEALQVQIAGIQQDTNTFFLTSMGITVFLMHMGFGLLEAGSVRSKNVTHTWTKNLVDPCVAAVTFWAIGYAFLRGHGPFIGTEDFFLIDFDSSMYAHWFFQFVFASTAATIVNGAMAERTVFGAYLMYSFLLTGFIYPVVGHWVWCEEGWLAVRGYHDYAGSSVVHATGGAAGLIGAYMLGPRIGRFDAHGRPQDMPGHSTVLSCLGGLILWVGFYAFNGGSEQGISGGNYSSDTVGLVITNTTIAGAFSALTVMTWKRLRTGKYSLIPSINGALCGMVAICSGCNVIQPWASLVIGFLAGLTYIGWSYGVLRCHVDDPLDAVAVHLGGGILGVLATPFFHTNEGMFYTSFSEDSLISLGWAVAGILAIVAWAMTLSGVLFYILNKFNLLRISEKTELHGLDIFKHEPAYPASSYRPSVEANNLPRMFSTDYSTKAPSKQDQAGVANAGGYSFPGNRGVRQCGLSSSTSLESLDPTMDSWADHRAVGTPDSRTDLLFGTASNNFTTTTTPSTATNNNHNNV